jgi:hypothetical protein
MMLLLRPPAARCELRGIAKPAALNDQAFREQSDPLAPPGRRGGCWPTSQLRFSGIRFGANDGTRAFGANDRSCGRRRGRAQRVSATGHRQRAASKDQQIRVFPHARARRASRARGSCLDGRGRIAASWLHGVYLNGHTSRACEAEPSDALRQHSDPHSGQEPRCGCRATSPPPIPF